MASTQNDQALRQLQEEGFCISALLARTNAGANGEKGATIAAELARCSQSASDATIGALYRECPAL